MSKAFPPIMAMLAMGQVLPVTAQSPAHFELENGRPVKLVWPSVPGRGYDLRESNDLRTWTGAPGFPKTAEGPVMEYAFESIANEFFRIAEFLGGGGWQLPALPALEPGTSFNFSAISALNATQLWVSGSVKPGDDACVLRSDDGGLTWALVYRAAGVGFFGDLHMTSPLTGFVAGSGLRRTADGGTTWQFEQGNLPDPPGTWHTVGPEGYVYGLAVVDQDHLWTAGYDGAVAGVIYHRVPDRPQPDPSNPNANSPWWLEWAVNNRAMYGISAVSRTMAWAVGSNGFVWKTSDGQSWTPQTSGIGTALQDVDAVDAATAWTVGDGGTILKTIDGGLTWTPQTSGTTETLWRIAAVDAGTAWAVGGGGTILHTNDGGTTWKRQPSGTTATLRAVAAVNSSAVWVAGDANTMLHTTDGGAGQWPSPVITGVSPSLVGSSSEPAMTLTISGSGFRGGQPRVSFGDAVVEEVTWIDGSTLQVAAPTGLVGTTDLKVTNEDGQQGTLPRAVTFLPTPLATEFAPLHGPSQGGYTLTVDGFNLQSVNHAAIYLSDGSMEAVPVAVVDSTRVVVSVPTSPTRPDGPSRVLLGTAQNQFVTVEEFRFDPASGPSFAVTAITPHSGTSQTSVTVTGVGFGPESTMELCDRPVVITSRSATHLTGVVSGPAGRCRLIVRNSETDLIVVDPGFLLTLGPAPMIAQTTPDHGPRAGGTSVTITGSGFQVGDTVTLDGHPAEITSLTSTTLVVTTPQHPPGAVTVIVMPEDLARPVATLPQGFTYE